MMNLRSLVPFGRERSGLTSGEADPFLSLHREIDRLFQDFGRGFGAFGPPAGAAASRMPRMDVSESETEIEITAELPGLEEKDVEISIADDLLTIRGETHSEREVKEKAYRLTERSQGSFYRTIELPHGVDPDAITARMAKGVLTLSIPKPKQSQARKVEIKAS